MTVVDRLPANAYTDAAWLAREEARLFEHSWTLVATSDDLAEPGAFMPVRVGRYPIVVIRQDDGMLRALHNICRHRGMAIVADAGIAEGRLRCRYHGWQYALDGRLEVVPQRCTQFPDLDVDACGLVSASTAEWGGMVFVHPDAGAAPLGATLGDLPNEIGSYQPELLTQVAHERIVGDFNWKLFVENHIDVYHLWYLHETTLGDFDHTRFEHRSLGANWVSYEPTKPSVPHVEHGIKHLADRDRNGIGAHMVFPNLLMATTADFFATYAVYPLAPTRSLIDLRIRADAGTDGAPLAAAARSFIDEDVNACEAVQAVTMSDRFDVGALARDHELLTLSKFHHNLLSALGEHP